MDSRSREEAVVTNATPTASNADGGRAGGRTAQHSYDEAETFVLAVTADHLALDEIEGWMADRIKPL